MKITVKILDREIVDLKKYKEELSKLEQYKDEKQMSNALRFKVCEVLKISCEVKQSNVYLLDEDEHIKKYLSIREIIDKYYSVVIKYQLKKKDYNVNKLLEELELIEYKLKFLDLMLTEKIVIFKKKKDEIKKQFT